MYIEYTPLEGQLQTILRNPVTAAALLAHVEAAEEAAATQVLQLQAEAADAATAAVVTAAPPVVSSARPGATEGELQQTQSHLRDIKVQQSVALKAAAAVAATKRKLSEALRDNLEKFHNGFDDDDEDEEIESYELIDIIDGEDFADNENEEYGNFAEAQQPRSAARLVNGGEQIVQRQSTRGDSDRSNNLVFELEDEDFEYVVTKVPKKNHSGQHNFERSLHKTFSSPTSINKAKLRPIPAAIPIVVHRNSLSNSVQQTKFTPGLRLLNGNLNNNFSRSISQDSFRSRCGSLSGSSCNSHTYIYSQRPQRYTSTRNYNGYSTAEFEEEEQEDDEEYSFNETHFELVEAAGGDYCLQENEIVVPVNKLNRAQDSSMGIDIFTKLRNLLYFNSDSKVETNEGKRKRRSDDWSPDAAAVHQIKYRKVDNYFPKIITGPLDNDLDSFPFPKKPEKPLLLQQHQHSNNQPRFVNVPLGMSHRRSIHSTENPNKPERKSLFATPQVTHKSIKNRSYADNEFSDDDESDFNNGFGGYTSAGRGATAFIGTSSHHDFNKTPKVCNIPIHRSEARLNVPTKPPPPPLIEARTGSILTSTHNLPEFVSTRSTYAETFRENNMTMGNLVPNRRAPSCSSTSSGGATTTFRRKLLPLGKCFGKGPSGRSVLQQENENEDLKKYKELLRQQVSNNNDDGTFSTYKVIPNVEKSRRSARFTDAAVTSTANNSPYANQRQLKRPPLTIDLSDDDDDDDDGDVEVILDTAASTRQRDHAPKHENINTDIIDVDDISDIELREDERNMLSACSKLTYNRAKDKDNEKEKENFRKRNELPHVDPVNSLKFQFSSSPHLKENWLDNFQAKHDKKKREQQEKVLQVENEALEKAALRREAEYVLQERFRSFKLYSNDLVIIDDFPEPEEEELPILTDAHNARIQAAIRGPPDQVLISKFNLNITRRDIHTLLGQNWLNDEVINFYMNLLTERGETKNRSHGMPRVYAMNTFFVPRLMQAGHAGVKRWTRKVDIFEKDIIPVPVHVGGVHWCMAIIHLKDQTIKYYDSMGAPNPNVLKALEQYLKDESMDKRKQTYDTSNFEIESVRDVPRQMNGSDCGVFSCMFAEFICRNKGINFSQQHMEYFRHKMILEIVRGELLH